MINEYKQIVVNKLKEYFDEYSKNSSYSSLIWDSMSYTTLLEGKRLRAIMCIETAKQFGVAIETVLPFACSLELMHAYSLIHDDLPCMDNDDLRRGKPSNHKVYSEGIATLAGDALISFGAQIIIDKTKNLSKEIVLDLVNDYLKTAGAFGIIAGQVADVLAEGKEIDLNNLNYIHKYKTGALFKCAMVGGAKCAQVSKDVLKKIELYAQNFGILFQIYDDIIDCTLSTKEIGKTAGKDKISKKLTYVSALGLEEAKNKFYGIMETNHDILHELDINSDIFKQIDRMLVQRIK